MTKTAEKFFRDIRGKKVAFMGIGVSHTELIKLFHEKGADVTACDMRTRDKLGSAADGLEALGVKLKLGSNYFDKLDCEILFRTPGMNYFLPELQAFRANGGIVTSEMEVFCDVCPCPVIAVTGSDGKTTTSTLIAKMLEAAGKTVHLGGNIGRALLPHALEMKESDFAVVELSSFQLISMRPSPEIAVVTNISPNHLDVHRDMLEYISAKKNIFAHQNAFSRTVLSFDNETAASFAPEIRGECVMFSLNRPQTRGAWVAADGAIMLADKSGGHTIMNVSDIRLPGVHNVSNYLAAICATAGYVSADTVKSVAAGFCGVEHRMEFVRELDGVKWYNDSIATTPTRAMAGLKAFGRKLILIAGGYDKNIPFDPLAPALIEHVKLLILTGPTASKIESAVTAHSGYRESAPEIIRAAGLAEAVKLARKAAGSGDVVSLSPACASFDAYANFEARGRHFKELVGEL